jgi:hypothetical protein
VPDSALVFQHAICTQYEKLIQKLSGNILITYIYNFVKGEANNGMLAHFKKIAGMAATARGMGFSKRILK